MVLTVISFGVESVVENGQQLTQNLSSRVLCVNHAISSAKFQSVVADYTGISKVLPVFSEFTNRAKMERCRVKVQNLKIRVLFKPPKRHEIMPIQEENQVVTSTKILQVPSLQLFSLQVVFIVSSVSD
jgi:hypothetical protein